MQRFSTAAVTLLVLCAGLDAHAQTSVPQTHQKLREIESAMIRGTLDPLRIGYQQQARERPGDVMLRVYLAWCTMPSDDAWNQLKGVQSIYPDNPWARLGMARVYLRWKMGDQAVTELAHVLAKDPRFYPAIVTMGEVARAAGRDEEALSHFKKALTIHDDPEAHAGIGWILAKQGDSAGAEKAFAQSIAKWAEQPRVLRELVRLARARKDVVAAANWSEKLAELAPRDATTRRILAELRDDSGDKPAALKEYDRAAKLGLVDVAVYRRISTLARELGEKSSEKGALEHLSALEKNVADHPARLSELAEAAGDLEAAEQRQLEAVERAPNRSDLRTRLARLLVSRERFRDALDAYREALAAPEQRPEGLEAEATALSDRFRVQKTKAKGTVDQVYWRVSANLDRFYKERLKAEPTLAGKFSIRVRVRADGTVEGADVVTDELRDPWLVGSAYFALKDAMFPKAKRAPVFEFELHPPKGKK